MSATRQPAPSIDLETAKRIAASWLPAPLLVQALDSYFDANFLVTTSDQQKYVLKVAHESESLEDLSLQSAMMECLGADFQGKVPTLIGEILQVQGTDGRTHFARLVRFLDGRLLADALDKANANTWSSLGSFLAQLDLAIQDLPAPKADRQSRWDLQHSATLAAASTNLWQPQQRALVQTALAHFASQVAPNLNQLPKQWIHNDANEFNLTVKTVQGAPIIDGIFDFGDAAFTPRIFELAIAAAYCAIAPQSTSEATPPNAKSRLQRVAFLMQAYHSIAPLQPLELQALFPSLLQRLATSVTISTLDAEFATDNPYLTVSQSAAWQGLEALTTVSPQEALRILQPQDWPGEPSFPDMAEMSKTEILEHRASHTVPSLSISYEDPLTILRGQGSWLFDEQGRGYLDGVNNVCHVGHCHPHVVQAGAKQLATLNTNTRYLHPQLARYSKRLTDLFPNPLSVCLLVNSGSEANELALRLARNYTGRQDVLALEGGYHGNTGNLIDISHYKHAGPGGSGPPTWVHTVPCPDSYRGPHRGKDCAIAYANHVTEAAAQCEPAAFLFEPLIGCGGQIVPPPGYLTAACQAARDAGAVVIADEVQVGFGRVGQYWWAHQLDDAAGGARPDIVTMGKPIGNGFPMAAVVTTKAIADAFANGMEFFNTFGGNPVACAIGSAVLDVIEEEKLLENARHIGKLLKDGIQELAKAHQVIGDVRGVGLYLGAEFVRDRESKQPDAQRLAAVLEVCRFAGVLFSSDGPDHNVLKIKPPIVWTEQEAQLALAVLQRALEETAP
ncbi:MAG: aminotransferase class III-fold pyridoxal phosphate-dependent enzyme [Planctomycetes bacterium]|nr:aminotransferase class III-fold pyridoxal phosphate-dependent enzyme [Planctomycetota bacterium]MCP4770416.1 aminotransferase class III-fold pyridoxal phosphate-dependent enzyme [Planctomycetota bacterium]MCP4860492.1 aminotransferase class III-fold pyridoxal phosphate-dependent enzyme [Planctomycetota bacterium]